MKNPENFEKIYLLYWEKLTAFSFNMTQDMDVAQNIVQDVFIDLWERRHKLEITAIESYLYRAAKNQVFKYYQNNRFDKTIIEDKFEDYIVDNFTTIDPEVMEKIYAMIENLPEKRKEILLMHKMQDMTIDQIAIELSLSKQTVKNQISSALKHLRFELKDVSWMASLLVVSYKFLR